MRNEYRRALKTSNMEMDKSKTLYTVTEVYVQIKNPQISVCYLGKQVPRHGNQYAKDAKDAIEQRQAPSRDCKPKRCIYMSDSKWQGYLTDSHFPEALRSPFRITP
jgi:hypothetical protein